MRQNNMAMSMVALFVTALAQASAAQMVNGTVPRVVYQNDQVVGRGIELTETANGKQHYFSHTESTKGGITEVDAWTDSEGHPLSAKYSEKSAQSWTVTTVEIKDGEAIMTRKSSSGEDQTVTKALPGDGVSLLAQFDPLKIYNGSPTGTAFKVSVIDPTQMAVTPGELAEQTVAPSAQPKRVFDLKTNSDSFEIAISADGELLAEKDSHGQICKPAPWDVYYLEMAQRAGISVNPFIVNQVLQNQTPPSQTPPHRKG
jgi:hypothetical protein